jgi:hypothetical protein
MTTRMVALGVLVLGMVAAIVAVAVLAADPRSAPRGMAVILTFLPYVVGAMVLRITRSAGLALSLCVLPAFVDIIYAFAFATGEPPTRLDEITWSAIRVMLTIFAVPVCFGLAWWILRPGECESGPSSS